MQVSIKTVLHIIGSLLGLGGVVFVVIRLAAYTEEIDLSQFDVTVWSLLCLLALAYGSASFFLIKAWQQILIYFKVQVANRWAIKTYGHHKSQSMCQATFSISPAVRHWGWQSAFRGPLWPSR